MAINDFICVSFIFREPSIDLGLKMLELLDKRHRLGYVHRIFIVVQQKLLFMVEVDVFDLVQQRCKKDMLLVMAIQAFD